MSVYCHSCGNNHQEGCNLSYQRDYCEGELKVSISRTTIDEF